MHVPPASGTTGLGIADKHPIARCTSFARAHRSITPPLHPTNREWHCRLSRQLTLFVCSSPLFYLFICLYLGRTGDTLCPVAAVLGYLAIRPAKLGPLFVFQDGTPLSRVRMVTHLREALLRAGLNDSFIQTLGRWKSSAFMAYIRTPVDDLVAVTAKLAGQ